MFITFEGGEGTGKSTQVKLLAERLRAEGKDVLATREPGGTRQGEELRALLVSGATGRWSAEAEALLNYAARDAHLRDVIRPALSGGKTVISDRFMDSTRAYQGHAGGCALALIDALEHHIVGGTVPNITLLFDLDPAIGLARAKARGGDDRFEKKGLAFHRKLREGFLAIAKANPKRIKLINADQTPKEVAASVWRALHG